MAEKKYLDLTALGYYDGKIKAHIDAKDATTLASAKTYADGLAVNYDAAGTAQTKVNELANGAVAANTAAIGVLNGSATTEGSVAKAVADLKAIHDSDVRTLTTNVDAAKDAADKAQEEVDALELLVGTLPEGTSATSVVDYVNVKTAGIATDAALAEIQGQLSAAQEAIDAIEEDYLKAADKTELQEQITANANGVAEIKGDYLKATDKTELQGSISANATAISEEIARAKAAEEKNAADIALILDNPDTTAVDSIKEFITYIDEHGEVATGLQTQITKNKDDLAAEVTRATGVEAGHDDRLKVLEAIDHEAYIAADTTLKDELTEDIEGVQSAVDAMDAAYKAADTALDGRVTALEGVVGDVDSVAGAIATAKQEAIDSAVGTAATDATSKADKALSDAKAYTDTEVDKVEGVANQNAADIATLSGRVTTAEGEIDALQAAVGDVTDVAAAIADAKKAGTDAQGEVDALEGVVATLTTRVGNQETACSAHGDRLTALESKVGDGFAAITNAEIDAMFTA